MITSTKSSKVKYIVRLQQKARFRHQEGLFVCEGKRLVSEVPPGLLREIYVTQEFLEDGERFRLILKLAVVEDEAHKKNSIITFMKINIGYWQWFKSQNGH